MQKTINGKDITFRKLTMGDMCALGQALQDRNLKGLGDKLKALYAASGIEEAKLPIVVAELSREPSLGETWRWIYTPEGTRRAVALVGGVSYDEVGSWPDAVGLGTVVNWALDATNAEGADGSIPLSATSGATAAT